MSLQIHPKTAKDLLRRCVCVCVPLLSCPPSLISKVPDVGFWFTPIDGPDMTLKCLLCEKRTFKANADCVRKHVARYHQQDYYNHLPSNGMCVLLNFIFFFSFYWLLLHNVTADIETAIDKMFHQRDAHLRSMIGSSSSNGSGFDGLLRGVLLEANPITKASNTELSEFAKLAESYSMDTHTRERERETYTDTHTL